MKTPTFRLLITLVALVTALGTNAGSVLGTTFQAEPPFPQQGGAHGIQIANMDLTTHPGDDFYQFANGAWTERTELLPSEPSYGALDEASNQVSAQLFSILLSLRPDDTTPEGKVRTLFAQSLDTHARDEAGLDPIRHILDDLAAITTLDEGLAYQERSFNDNMFGLFIPYADSSPVDATTNAAWLAGPFLNLPSEDYYLDDDEESQAIRDAWVNTTAELLVAYGYDEDEANTAAAAVLAFDTEIARIKTPDEVAQTDPNVSNNPRTIAEMEDILPSFDWHGFLEANGIPDVETMYVDDIAYLEGLQELLDNADPRILQYVFAAEMAWGFSSYLTSEIEDIAFSFQGPTLLGVDQQSPLEGRAMSIAASVFPDALGKAYVAKAFSADAKAQIEELVANLIAAYRIRIQQSTWMGEETKAKAIEKLDLMGVKVGYPDEWETYDDVAIGDTLFETVANASAVSNAADLASIGQPVDRAAWSMAVFEVNAYYDPTRNEIVFPAAILQPPFYDPEADLASNYGSIGAVIGHEITHGFDLSGSQFDGHGNLVDWWTEDDIAAFLELNERVVDHYSGVEALPGVFTDGELTVTENVADMGGVQVAYDALQIALDTEGPDDRFWLFSQQERFFIAFASTWRERARPEFIQLLVDTDEHAPAQVRAVEPLRMMDTFYEVFGIGPDDPEYLPPDERIVIW